MIRPVGILLLSFLASPSLAQRDVSSGKPPGDPIAPITPAPPRHSYPQGNLAVGDRAPSFVLDAADGRSVKLSSLRGDWLALVFADTWQQVSETKSIETRMSAVGAKVVGITHEKVRTLSSASSRKASPRLMLADVTGEVSAQYGLYDSKRKETRPGVVILDREGVIRLAIVTLDRVPPPESIAELTEFLVRGY